MAITLQTELEKASSLETSWQGRFYNNLEIILKQPSNFPCVFSQSAFAKKNIVFTFMDTLEPADLASLAEDLKEYVIKSKLWDGEIATAQPLIVAFNPNVSSTDVEGYHKIGWAVLQYLHDHDEAPWPVTVAKDANQPFWSMCYAGMEIFVNMSCPAHINRKSRNLGASLCFVINPRERFDVVAGNNERGWNVRRNIRKRVHAYDGIEHSPQLGSFKAGEIEWWQYGLSEKNSERTDKCPFKAR